MGQVIVQGGHDSGAAEQGGEAWKAAEGTREFGSGGDGSGSECGGNGMIRARGAVATLEACTASAAVARDSAVATMAATVTAIATVGLLLQSSLSSHSSPNRF